MRAILTGLEAPRWRVAARRHWGLETRVWGVGGERRLHTTSATMGSRSSESLLNRGGEVERWRGIQRI